MRATRFGRMQAFKFPFGLTGGCEVMQFDAQGKAHTHNLDEVAICCWGSGRVIVEGPDGAIHDVAFGDEVIIPAGAPHYMVPTEGETMAMFIGYKRER